MIFFSKKLFLIFPPLFDINKKAGTTRSNFPIVLDEWIFWIIFFYVFVDEMIIKIFVYLLITNTSLDEDIVNLFKHDTET